MFKKYLFKNKILPDLLEQVSHYSKDKKIIISINVEDDDLSLFILIDKNIIIFKKNKDTILTKDIFHIEPNIKIDNKFIDYILYLKNHGTAFSGEQIIDAINQNIIKYIAYFKFTRLEIENIYAEVINHNFVINNNITALNAIEYNSLNHFWID